MGESFSEWMRRRWAARRGGDGAGRDSGPGSPYENDDYAAEYRSRYGRGDDVPGRIGPGADPEYEDSGAEFGPSEFEPGPDPETTGPGARVRSMHENLVEAYAQGDVDTVARIASLMPDGPAAEPYRSYARVLAAEAQGDDLAASQLARLYLDSIAPGHPEWETARKLYGEVTVQGLVLGKILLADNLQAAREALADQGDEYCHPSGFTLRFDPEEDQPLLMLLDGEVDRSVRVARRNVRKEHKGTPAGLADSLCTLALCLCAKGDLDGAREALDQAAQVLPNRPRIAVTRERVESSPAARVRLDKDTPSV